MGKYFFRMSYIGTLYRGVQKHLFAQDVRDTDTIQGALEAALSTIKPKSLLKPYVYISSRTDAGVHALYSSGHTELYNKDNLPFDSEKVLQQVNRYLIKSGHTIRLLEWYPVSDDFHARHNARSRTYLYRILTPKKISEHRIPLMELNRSFHLRSEEFDVERVKEGLKLFEGRKDYRTFAKDLSGKQKHFVRELTCLKFERGQALLLHDMFSQNYDFWDITCTARSFLYNQVRRIVGSLIALGTGKITEREIKIMLTVPSYRNWDSRIVPVPAAGLYLKSVDYDPETLENLIQRKKQHLKPCKTLLTDMLGNKYEVENGSSRRLPGGLPFVVDTKPDMQVARILPGLYLSSQDPAACRETLRRYVIRHVLSIGMDSPPKFTGIRYHRCELLDLPDADITKVLKTCLLIVHDAREQNILVHCNAGVSRSSTVVIAYLMALQGVDYETALHLVRRVRSCAKPNAGFVRQLTQINLRDLLPEISEKP